jgi:hypothetical protein
MFGRALWIASGAMATIVIWAMIRNWSGRVNKEFNFSAGLTASFGFDS